MKKKKRKKFLNQQPSINLVPFIDILFTIMIFLVVTSNFSATDVQADAADHYPHPEIVHHQRLSAAVYDLSERAFPVHAALRPGPDPLYAAGLFRRDGPLRLLQRYQPDPYRHDSYL